MGLALSDFIIRLVGASIYYECFWDEAKTDLATALREAADFAFANNTEVQFVTMRRITVCVTGDTVLSVLAKRYREAQPDDTIGP